MTNARETNGGESKKWRYYSKIYKGWLDWRTKRGLLQWPYIEVFKMPTYLLK